MSDDRQGGEHNIATAQVRTLPYSAIRSCPFSILMPSHYRADNSCKCSNREHRDMMIKEWGYRRKQFAGIPLVD